MTIVRLKGGMGNQMFQYAFGLEMARRSGSELRLDPTNLLNRNAPVGFVYRNYDLDVFQVSADNFLASPKLLAPIYNLRLKKLSAAATWLIRNRREVVREPHFHCHGKYLGKCTGQCDLRWLVAEPEIF